MSSAPTIPGSEFGGFIGLIVGLLLFVLAVMWLIFPIIVLSKFNELLRIDREITNGQREIINGQREIANALQWMVNNWKQEVTKPPDQQPPPV
jgi:hypothetical protein